MSDWQGELIEACELADNNRLSATDARRRAAAPGGRPAAVLIGVRDTATPSLLFTERSRALTHHPGQISFPGGRVEADDESEGATARREAQEEIGLAPEAVTLLGRLATYHTVTGFSITPLVASIAPQARYAPDGNEVVRILDVPLGYAMTPANFRFRYRSRDGRRYRIYSLDYDGDHIWGATAAMLCDLAERVARVRGKAFTIQEASE